MGLTELFYLCVCVRVSAQSVSCTINSACIGRVLPGVHVSRHPVMPLLPSIAIARGFRCWGMGMLFAQLQLAYWFIEYIYCSVCVSMHE